MLLPAGKCIVELLLHRRRLRERTRAVMITFKTTVWAPFETLRAVIVVGSSRLVGIVLLQTLGGLVGRTFSQKTFIEWSFG